MTFQESKKMYFAVIDASPRFGTEGFQKYDAANIACWVNTTDLALGRQRAIGLVEQNGWFVKGVKEEKIILASDYESTNEGLRYFEQALTDGEVCVAYTCPLPGGKSEQ